MDNESWVSKELPIAERAITTKYINKYCWELYFYNGVYMGDCVEEVCGDFVFYPKNSGKFSSGYWDSGTLKAIAKELDELNNEQHC